MEIRAEQNGGLWTPTMKNRQVESKIFDQSSSGARMSSGKIHLKIVAQSFEWSEEGQLRSRDRNFGYLFSKLLYFS